MVEVHWSGNSVRLAAAIGVLVVLLIGCEMPRSTPAQQPMANDTISRPLRHSEISPRSVEDIADLLRTFVPDDRKMQWLRQRAERQFSAGETGVGLALALVDRANARASLGQSEAALDDLRGAHDALYASPLVDASQRRLLVHLVAEEELEQGDLEGFFARMKRLSEEFSAPSEARIFVLTHVASIRSLVGLLDVAEAEINEARSLYYRYGTQSGSDPSQRGINPVGTRHAIAVAEASLAFGRGDFRDAEVKWRYAIELGDQNIANIAAGRQAVYSRDTTLAFYAGGADLHRLMLANILARLNKFVEAEAIARYVIDSRRQRYGAGDYRFASAVSGLADVLVLQGRHSESETLWTATVDLYRRTGLSPSSRLILRGMLARAELRALNGQWGHASQLFEEIQAMAADTKWRGIARSALFALALSRTGKHAEALQRIDLLAEDTRPLRTYDDFEDANSRRGIRAVILAAAGQVGTAERLFEEVLANDDPYRIAVGSRRHRIMQLIYETYVRLLLDGSAGAPHRPDAVDRAFKLSDISRGRAVQQAVARAAAKAQLPQPELRQLLAREQDLQQKLDTYERQLIDATYLPEDVGRSALQAQLRRQSEKSGQDIDALREIIAARFPDYGRLLRPAPVGVDEVRPLLADDEALLSFYVTEQSIHVWTLTRDLPTSVHDVKMPRGDVEQLVERVRSSFDAEATRIRDIPPFDLEAAHRLFIQLVQPALKSAGSKRRVVIVPHGKLATIPFDVLVASEPTVSRPQKDQVPFAEYRQVHFLIRDSIIAHVPTVATFVALRRLPSAPPDRPSFIGVGDPVFDAQRAANTVTIPAATCVSTDCSEALRRSRNSTVNARSAGLKDLPELPETADELRTVARVLQADPERDLLLGADATEQRVVGGALADRRVIMFATHGLKPGDLDGLTSPALALSAPAQAEAATDGVLTLEEVLGLKIDADWVVMSACNTAAANGIGAEALSGLGRGFFHAGARALLVSHWSVETSSARFLTTRLFEAYAQGASKSAALRIAELSALDTGQMVSASGEPRFSYSHPLFWAPFSVVGDGR